jgi:hypothetical protein
MTHLDDVVLRAALTRARELEPTDAQIDRAVARARGSRSRVSRRMLVLTASIALIASATVSVPATRAAIDDALSSFASWIDGDEGSAPGRALRGDDDAPAWVRAGAGPPRLIADEEGVELYAVRTADGKLGFALDGSVGIEDSAAGWRSQFDQHAVVVLGPGGVDGQPFDDRGRRPLFGVTARSVTRVELRYASGPPLAAEHVDGGFVLLADPRRPVRELVAFDAAGQVLDRADLRSVELRVCRDERGCPPGALEP